MSLCASVMMRPSSTENLVFLTGRIKDAMPSVSDGLTSSAMQQLRNVDPLVSDVLLCIRDDAVFFV
jgi:hypothetical protein